MCKSLSDSFVLVESDISNAVRRWYVDCIKNFLPVISFRANQVLKTMGKELVANVSEVKASLRVLGKAKKESVSE